MSVYPSIRFNLYSKADVYFLAAVNDWTIDDGLSITPPFVLDLSARAHIVYTKYRRNIVFFFFLHREMLCINKRGWTYYLSSIK
jgi:hypothetical protein